MFNDCMLHLHFANVEVDMSRLHYTNIFSGTCLGFVV